MTIIQGDSLLSYDSMFTDVFVGSTFTATYGQNFFILFQATSSTNSGQFAFSLNYLVVDKIVTTPIVVPP